MTSNITNHYSGSNLDMLNCYGIVAVITEGDDNNVVQTDECFKKSLKCIGQSIAEDADEKCAAIYLDMCGANREDIQKVVEIHQSTVRNNTLQRLNRVHTISMEQLELNVPNFISETITAKLLHSTSRRD